MILVGTRSGIDIIWPEGGRCLCACNSLVVCHAGKCRERLPTFYHKPGLLLNIRRICFFPRLVAALSSCCLCDVVDWFKKTKAGKRW